MRVPKLSYNINNRSIPSHVHSGRANSCVHLQLWIHLLVGVESNHRHVGHLSHGGAKFVLLIRHPAAYGLAHPHVCIPVTLVAIAFFMTHTHAIMWHHRVTHQHGRNTRSGADLIALVQYSSAPGIWLVWLDPLWLLSDKGTHVRFCWIPSHCNINAIEMVDHLAKEMLDHDIDPLASVHYAYLQPFVNSFIQLRDSSSANDWLQGDHITHSCLPPHPPPPPPTPHPTPPHPPPPPLPHPHPTPIWS